jgi:hypothetical protein
MIITVSGLAGTGKDTFADVLVKKHNFRKIALADSLRKICSEVFEIPMEMFLDRDKKDSPMQNSITATGLNVTMLTVKANEKAGIPHKEIVYPSELKVELKTPRDVLKWAGTEVIRRYCGEDIWIEIAKNKIRQLQGRVVISDARFENERRTFKELGATLVLIKRPNFPIIDPSESTGQDLEYDVIFSNDSCLVEFQSSVDMWFTLKRDLLAYGKSK